MYCVEVDSKLGQFIKNTKFGIDFHTHYTWDHTNLSSLELLDFDVYESEFKKSKDVFLQDSYQVDCQSLISFSESENNFFNSLKTTIKSLIPNLDFEILGTHKDIIQIFSNYIVKQNIKIDVDILDIFDEFLAIQKDKELSKSKSEKGKAKIEEKYQNINLSIKDNFDTFESFFEIYRDLQELKKLVIQHLNKVQKLKTFVIKRSGDLVPTTPEGYVITNGPMSSKKLVDRYEFSHINFDSLGGVSEFLHGFDR